MSKPICLLLALVILTTILCNNSVCSQRSSWKQINGCGCRFHPSKGLQCKYKTNREYSKIVKCICSHPEKYFAQQFIRMCRPKSIFPSIPL